MKKQIEQIFFIAAAFFFFQTAALNAQDSIPQSSGRIPLLGAVQNEGIVFFWDSLSQTGVLERSGHQLSFRAGEQLVLLDS